MTGYAICGSFCTHGQSFDVLGKLISEGYDIQPIFSETAYSTDTRFGKCGELVTNVEAMCGRSAIHTIKDAEPLGPASPLDMLIIAPCTGNTLAKLASGITDTAVCMAAKAHMRRGGTVVIALATNDAMSANLQNIAAMLNRKNVFFVPMKQDDPKCKPHSLVADFSRVSEAVLAASCGEQLRPLFV